MNSGNYVCVCVAICHLLKVRFIMRRRNDMPLRIGNIAIHGYLCEERDMRAYCVEFALSVLVSPFTDPSFVCLLLIVITLIDSLANTRTALVKAVSAVPKPVIFGETSHVVDRRSKNLEKSPYLHEKPKNCEWAH